MNYFVIADPLNCIGCRTWMVACVVEHSKEIIFYQDPKDINFIPKLEVVKNAQVLGAALSEYGFRIVSGGTDTHLLLVDLRPKKLTGKQLEKALDYVGVTVNKNMIPFDPEKPMVTSGVRIGTTAMTIKGMKEQDIKEIGSIINKVANSIDNEDVLNEIRNEVLGISQRFPLYERYFKELQL